MNLEKLMKSMALITAIAFASATNAASADVVADTPSSAAPAATTATAAPDCRRVNKGGPIAGITIGAVFWPLLPLSIPLLVTQSKKLKRRNAEIYEQSQRGCPQQ